MGGREKLRVNMQDYSVTEKDGTNLLTSSGGTV
jgi:hypothetical protein